MKNDKRNTLIAWLNDAYAMENSLVQVLTSHSKDAEEYPDVKKKIDEHIEQTKNQAERVKTCIENLGGDVSETKAGLSKLMGAIEGGMSHMPSDKIIKNAITEFASENMEIAAYSALVSAADEIGEDEVSEVCQDILDQERETAEWLEANLPDLVTTFLQGPELEQGEE